MSELLKTLSNIRSLRVLAREVSLEQLESCLEKLTFVVEEKRESVKAQELENQKRLDNLKKYKELLEEDGISAEELAQLLSGFVPAVKKRDGRAARPAKYKFLDNGIEKTWTGQGRTPKALQQQLDSGKSLQDFEI